MTISEKLQEIEEHINLWMGEYSRKDLVANNVRIATEAACKAVILKNKGETNGTEIILGKNRSIPRSRKSTFGQDLSLIDLITTVVNDLHCAPKYIYHHLELIRNRANFSSHSSNSSKDKMKLEDLEICNTSIKAILNWLFPFLNISMPDNIKTLFATNNTLDGEIILDNDKWREFEIACGNFDYRRYQYLLVAPETISDDSFTVNGISRLPWRLVIDFNPKSDILENGLLKNFDDTIGLGKKKSFKINDKIEFDQNFPHYWFFANGLGSFENTPDYKKWRNKYKTYLSENLYKEFLKGSRIKSRIVVLLNISVQYAYDIIDEFNRMDEDNLKFILCSTSETYDSIFETFDNVELHKISAVEISHGVHNSDFGIDNTTQKSTILIPSIKEGDKKEKTFISVTKDHYDYLNSLGIDLIYKDIESSIPSDEENEFYKGATINWKDLAEQKDINRLAIDNLQIRLENQLKENRLEINKLIHQPGAGGTTLGRRIAFNLSLKYPTILLRKYMHKKTIDAIRIIYDQYTKGSLPLLIVLEAFEVKESDLLHRELSNAKKNAVILVIQRGFLERAKDKRFTLKAQLEGREISAFENSFKQLSPSNKELVLRIPKDYKDTPQYISPVLYALTAFGKDYSGLQNYILKSLEGITLEQRKLTGLICIIYHYTQKSIPAELFSNLFGVDRSKSNLTKILGPENPLFALLHEEVDNYNEYNNFWRPRYALLGEEAMQIVISGGAEYKKNWKNQLGSWLLELIKIVRSSMPYLDDDTSQIFNSLFIERSNSDYIVGEKKEFTKVFDDIVTVNEGRAIFEELINSYPDEAHYHGHYARYLYSDNIGIRDYDNAIIQAEESLNILSKNSSLIHTLGMCYKEKAENLINNYERFGLEPEEAEETIKNLVESSCDEFDNCIDEDPYNIYGYESQIRILLKVLDFGFNLHNSTSKESFISNPINSWYAEKLDKVSQLLEEALYAIEQLKKIENKDRVQKSEGFILDCEGLFFRSLGQHLTAKTRFEELVKNTPKGYEYMRPRYRRMFVMCLLAFHKSRYSSMFEAWNGVSEAELNQCVEYLDANIIEDPNNVQNIKIWLQAVRHLKTPPSIITVISRIATWTQVTNQTDNSLLEGYYYMYVLNAIKTIGEGNTFDQTTIQTVKDVLEKMKPFVKNEKFCFEWYGSGYGLNQMVNHKKLGEFTTDFFEKNKAKISEVTGRIKVINSSQQGIILLDCGLEAFFVPNIHGFTERNVNDRVKFYVGFRYDQIQAWSVLLLNKDRNELTKANNSMELNDMIDYDNSVSAQEDIIDNNESEKIKHKIEIKIDGPKIVGKIDLIDENSKAKKNNRKTDPIENKTYDGIIKIFKNNKGYIKVEQLNKDIAFNSRHLKGNKMELFENKTNVKVTIKFQNGTAEVDFSKRNYIAESVNLVSNLA